MVQIFQYVRWSSDKQTDSDSLPRQRALCAAMAAQRGWPEPIEILDEAVSAFTGANIQWGEMSKFADRLTEAIRGIEGQITCGVVEGERRIELKIMRGMSKFEFDQMGNLLRSFDAMEMIQDLVEDMDDDEFEAEFGGSDNSTKLTPSDVERFRAYTKRWDAV